MRVLSDSTSCSSTRVTLDARRYVNNICQTVRVPLVESGTAGYLGQCTVILPVETLLTA